MENEANNDLNPLALVLAGGAAGYKAAANSTKAALIHIANGDADAAYHAAAQAASIMSPMFLRRATTLYF